MTPPQIVKKTGQNFAVAELGDFSNLDRFSFEIEGKIFLKQLLDLTSVEISLNSLLPKKSIPFYHKHRLNEEIYLFVRGEGEFQVDDRVFSVREGTVVRVDPEGERCLRNVSDTEKLCWIVVQSRANSYSDYTIQDGFGLPKRVSWQNKQRI